MEKQPKHPFLQKNQKKIALAAIVILVIFALVILALRLLAGEDNWICQNGEWVKHGNPSSPEPTTFCDVAVPLESQQPEDKSKEDKSKIDTSNWIAYRNTAYGFDLKYPPENWKVTAVKNEDPNTSPTPTFNHLCRFDVYCGALGIYAKQDGYNPSYKLDDYFYILDLKEVVSKKTIKIGSEDALRAEFTRTNTPAEQTEVIIYVLHKGKIFRIFPTNPTTDQSKLKSGDTIPYADVQDAILASFKFAD